MQQIRMIFFILATVANFAFSWRALKNPNCHGFYRFFVFETIIILFAFNLPYWFQRPFIPRQILAWLILFISLYYAITAFYLLIKKGRSSDKARLATNYTFESTGELVKTGLYKWIRHPMYGSLLLLAWGIFLKNITPATIACVGCCTLFVWLTAKVEEKENILSFGDTYESYRKVTKMFIPFLW